MKVSNIGVVVVLALLAVGMAQTAQAQVKVTEIWQSGNGSSTPDWFELTNIGGAAIDPSSLFYDDDHDAAEEESALTGITNLDPGESGIYLVSWQDDYLPSGPDFNAAISAFDSYWGVGGAYQVGYILQPNGDGGHGLSGGGDTVNIYDSSLAGSSAIESRTYVGANAAQTWVVDPNTDALVAALPGFDGGYPSAGFEMVGSPGAYNVPTVPEPASVLLMVLGLVGIGLARRRR